MHQSKIFIVATPIGNLQDMTFRAIETLKQADIIAAEDTRVTRKLLKHFGIEAKELISYHDHIEQSRTEELISRLNQESLNLAIVSDAGTPCISDPGFKIVAKAKEVGIPVHPIPGASAVISLISAAGLPCDRFTFSGFLPVKPTAIEKEMLEWQNYKTTIVFFESTKRLKKSIPILQRLYPDCQISMGRELTKLYEEIITLPIQDFIDNILVREQIKGEVVCMVNLNINYEKQAADDLELLIPAILQSIKEGASHKDMMIKFRDYGLKKKELYQLILDKQNES